MLVRFILSVFGGCPNGFYPTISTTKWNLHEAKRKNTAFLDRVDVG